VWTSKRRGEAYGLMATRLVSIPRAFLRRIPGGEAIADHASDAEVMTAARQAWDASPTAEHLVLALGALGDRRLIARATCVVLRLAEDCLASATPPRKETLDRVERWAAGIAVDELAMAHAREGDPPAPGPDALMALAIESAAHLLDLNDPAPELSAMGAVDVAASALADAGIVTRPADARRMFAEAVRRAIDPWPDLAAATALVAVASDETEPLPF